jgi:probable biosynthetic protein (TIGR04098 family)
MLIQPVDLTLSHVGLGSLNEFAAMAIFGDVLCRRLTDGTNGTVKDVTDVNGQTLYPAFYCTHLTVPADHLLDQHGLWSKVTAGVDVSSFGGMIVDARFVLGDHAQVPSDPEQWECSGLPFMRGGVLWVVDASRATQATPAVPKRDLVSKLPKSQTTPASVETFEAVQRAGTVAPDFSGTLRQSDSISYRLHFGRDLALGHAAMFATFVWIQEHAERILLAEQVSPRFPSDLLAHLLVTERESYYVTNTYGDEPIEIRIRAAITACPTDLCGAQRGLISAAMMTFVTEMYGQSTARFLFASRAKKVFAIPAAQKMLHHSAHRLLMQHG